ncbi:MAG TPA: hypothetical protein VM657_03555 [Sphingomonas sp.]|nr:hypothetical protein [Sphingomonas sp.]
MRALDWIGRVLVLVLSALATLSIVASLVSVSAPIEPERREGEIARVAEPLPEPQPRVTSAPGPADTRMTADDGTGRIEAPADRDAREIARWLRALTYAVLGLAGFVAVLVIVAMRATAHLGAIADRG